jgi:tetratricopeptide (TPR) repeat protein
MIGKSLGHYEILDTIGSGGMGQVYRARDTKLGRDVALKLLPAALRSDEKALARFKREARALAALNHPNIVTIYSIEDSENDLFITMELVEGKSIESCFGNEGMTVEKFQNTTLPLTDALVAAHASGIIHRDLKPSNIMITETGIAKVLDFGVALVMNDEQLTDTNTTVGTVAYMSPEQISGGEVDDRSDIFSLGIVFYELWSGVRPFRGEHLASMMYSIINEDAPRLTSAPDAVADVIDRCLKKIPGDRFAGAEELRHALRDLTVTSTPTLNTVRSMSSPEARTAFDRGEWEAAYKLLNETREQRDLTPEELEMQGTCASWLSEFDQCTQAWERACADYAKAGKNIAAARVALELVGLNIEMNATTVAGGWQKRAERLLQNEPDCIERGHLLRRQTVVALAKFDFTCAMELNRECEKIANSFNDPDLQAVALHDRGQILIARGDVEEGTGLIDEAMTSAVSGEVRPGTLGNLYCRTMSVCRSLVDFKRAREWSEAASRWSESYAASGYPGVCRIHNAEAMRHQGQWEKAEEAVRSACRDFEKSGISSHAGEAFNELGELALRKGNYQEAEDAFRRAHEFGCDPVPGISLLRLAQGNNQAARQTIERALEEDPENRLRQAKLYSASIIIAVAGDKLSDAEAAIAALTNISKDFSCRCFKAHALMGRGALELKRGNYDVATPVLREAWSIFNEMSFPYDAARARTIMAEAYLKAGNKEDAMMQLEAACKTFQELGAIPDLEAASQSIKKST